MKLVHPSNPILREVQPPYDGDPCVLRSTASELWRLMKAPRFEDYDEDAQRRLIETGTTKLDRGIGIAAPQAGLRLRMFVMQLQGTKFNEARVCINPVVMMFGAPVDGEEGCLTWPGKRQVVERSSLITAMWLDLKGNRTMQRFEGLAARCFLHELDHLDGRTIWS